MKYIINIVKQSFLNNFLQLMVSIWVMMSLPLQLMSAPVIISVQGIPTLIGTQNEVGAIGLWENAGTVDGISIDLRATIIALNGDKVEFSTNLDDPTMRLGRAAYATLDSEVTIRWEIFISGTNQTVPAVGTILFSISDIDGINGAPYTRETVIPSLTGLSGYTVDNPTNLQVNVIPGLLKVTGTQNQQAEVESTVIFNYNNISSWDTIYQVVANNVRSDAVFIHDGDKDKILIDPQTVVFLTLDLDDDNSTATGNDYAGSYMLGTSGVVITDIDTNIMQDASLGTDLGSATITLTNAQANDILTIGALPAGITGTVDTSVTGVITVTLTGTATVSDYETALQAITFSNNDKTANYDDRVFEFFVTNEIYGISSEVAISTITVSLDTDGDGTPDTTDLDDDNDGILDTDEGNGMTDTDGDGIPNSLDLDSDNDGIPDIVEAQPTATYTTPTGVDTDHDGLDDAFDPNNGGTAIVLQDTDNDGTPDVLDTDSDNDGIDDINESGLQLTGTDTNNDGIDDGVHASYKNPGGDINIPATDLSNTQNATTPEVDYREGPKDTDGDGVPDATDIDDDNDGILDTDEGNGVTDIDGDGIPNSLDLDSDNDGIPDIVEAQPTATYTAPTGLDTDHDGLDNAFDPNNGGTAIVLQDTDNDGTLDVIDRNSDNDTILDIYETGLQLTHTDTNNDGIDDGVHASYADPDGDVNTPATDLSNTQNATTPEVDYRDATTPYTLTIETVDGKTGSPVETTDTTPEINGTCTPDDNGIVIVQIDGVTIAPTATCKSDGTYSIVPNTPLALGDHNVIATESDNAGNIKTTDVVVVTIKLNTNGDKLPDYDVALSVSKTTFIDNAQSFFVTIRISELLGGVNTGDVVYSINKNSNISLSFDNALTANPFGQAILNADFEWVETPSMYQLVYRGNNSIFPASGRLYVGVSGVFTPPSGAKGKFIFKVNLRSGSGDTNEDNNEDSDAISYSNIN